MVALLVIQSAPAQTPGSELKSKITNLRYPPIAESARIHGDVRINIAAGLVKVLSGHPLLAPIALASANLFGSIQHQSDVDLVYHFVLVDTINVPTRITVKKGNGFERAILRMFGFKTEKVVLANLCQEGDLPASDLRISGTTIEIWIYGRTRCVQTQATELLARR